MAYIGNLFIAGTDAEGGKFKSGAVYSLSKGYEGSYLYAFDDKKWEVEFDGTLNSVVARCTIKLSYDELMGESFERIQKALDIMSVKGISSITLKGASRQNIGIYWENEKSVLCLYGMHDMPMSVSCTVVHTDSNGKEIPQPIPEEPLWVPSFRYYRLSQASTDLFEAYRNLFLSFEALLNEVFPIKNRENEGAWLRRCLGEINKVTSLSQFTQNDDDPAEYIIKNQYKNIRCRLLHAKFPKAELPHALLDPREVAEAYRELIRIWRHIASHYFKVPSGGGVITYTGFEMMMSTRLSEEVNTSYTGDETPPSKNDIKVSPKGQQVHKIQQSIYKGVITPGIVGVEAIEEIESNVSNYEAPIFRACMSLGETLFCVMYINGGLKFNCSPLPLECSYFSRQARSSRCSCSILSAKNILSNS